MHSLQRKVLRTICPDQKGLIARITNICYKHELNIVQNNEFVDHGPSVQPCETARLRAVRTVERNYAPTGRLFAVFVTALVAGLFPADSVLLCGVPLPVAF